MLPVGNRLLLRSTLLVIAIGIFFFTGIFDGIKFCHAKEISVELVWKFGDAAWIEILIEDKDYILKETTSEGEKEFLFPKGSRLEMIWGGWTPVIRKNYDGYEIWKGSKISLVPQGEKGVFRIRLPNGDSVSYRGSLTLQWEVDHWKLVNTLDTEDYLKGVVPIEMSNGWATNGLEALKAQAVAARTYMVRKLRANNRITDSPNYDQAYLGRNVEGAANRAVDETRGEILVDSSTYAPIDALYSSHNGGYTELPENVWSNPDPHFSSHPDPFSDGIGGAADRWRFIVAGDHLGKVFGLGPIKDIQLEKFPSGRVKKVTLVDVYSNSKSVSGRELVQKFYPYGRPIQSFAFLGNLFDVEKINGNNEFLPKSEMNGPRLNKIISSSQGVREYSAPYNIFIFWGRGWGHGVGMSQWGAYKMAQNGYTYEDILYYYYKNVLLIKDYV